MEQTFKQRLERVISVIEAKASQDWNDAQGQQGVAHNRLIGWASGGKHAVRLLKAEFADVLLIYEAPEPPGDEPVEPFHYIDSNNALFRDRYGRYYFWCENYMIAHGPYDNTIEVCEAMRQYNESLNSGTISELPGTDQEDIEENS